MSVDVGMIVGITSIVFALFSWVGSGDADTQAVKVPTTMAAMI